MLWGRTNASYALALLYVCGNAAVYGFELVQFFVFGNRKAALPISAIVLSCALLIGSFLSVLVFALDYAKYRSNRQNV
jgi:TRAP-type C4-dicarboxylate transport system permease small subunit